ncbi:MAG: hypothetical protein E8D52_06000 [Nitrospira sp.]|nr:MAG: hypothetical protein E8D52_06000 [Nitrospira sp.]
MLIEASIPLRVRLRSGEVRLRPGHPVRFHDADGRKLLARAPGKVHCVMPEPPLRSGWFVAYRNQRNRLHDGTVSRCDWIGTGWTIHLTSGTAIPFMWVTSVSKTDAAGKVIAAWLTSRHGFDGERERGKP